MALCLRRRFASCWRRNARFFAGSDASSGNSAAAGPLKRYEEMVAQGMLRHDEQQHRVASLLDTLLDNLKTHQKNMEYYNIELQSWMRTRKELREQMLQEEAEEEARRKAEASKDWKEMVRKMLTRKGTKRDAEAGAGKMVAKIKREKMLDAYVGPRPVAPQCPQGMYLYGNVGCGKTLLMDLLFGCTKGVVKYRRRMHFHAAMLELHDRMHKVSKQLQEQPEEEKDPDSEDTRTHVSPIFDAVAEGFVGEVGTDGASLLCFDEVQVVDPFTAVALAGVLGKLLKKGVVLVATSNRPFTDLNKDGFQRGVFLKFIEQVESQCLPVFVGDEVDYRRVLAESYNKEKPTQHYFWPLNRQSEEELTCRWRELTTENVSGPSHVPVMFGRSFEVLESCNGIARFTFEQLCNQPVGSPDYIALAQHFHTVFITEIPIMSRKIRDKARRFITLVDELYNHHCQLICTAAAPPDELFLGTEEGALIDLEGLQFETEAEEGKLRRNVLVSGSVSPLKHDKSVQTLLSGYEEMFAFRRAASRLIEMQSESYVHKTKTHPKYV